MKQWFYSVDGSQKGPVSEAEILALIEQGRFHEDTLVWTDGMPNWLPVTQVPALQSSPYSPPATEVSEEVDWDQYVPTGSQVRPWIRLWARTFDFTLATALMWFVVERINPALSELGENPIGLRDNVANVLMAVISIPMEALCFAAFGTTPFKALFNIRVRNPDGSKLGFNQALKRSFSVFLRGSGIGIPIVAIVANIIAYSHLTTHKVTSWDRDLRLVVSHQTIPAWRVLLILAVFFAIIFLSVAASESGL